MKDRPRIKRIELHEFEWEMHDFGKEPSISRVTYVPGSKVKAKAAALKVITDLGITGEYMTIHGDQFINFPAFASLLIGRNALDREAIYQQLKLLLKHRAIFGIGVLDIALWDLAGKFYDAPICELLGTFRTSIPCYASSMAGDDHPEGLSSPEAYADLAESCLERGYRGFKIHPWQSAPVRRFTDTVHAVGKRAGGKMDLMLDMFSCLNTFGEAVKVGRACDEEGFFWWEDPMRDNGASNFLHRKLRQIVKTPLAQLELKPGLEQHVDAIIADSVDFVRADVHSDGGITGVLKIAHACEGFGLDVELHGPGPAQRHLLAAIRNANYYELGLFHPKAPYRVPPVYKDGYRDDFESIDRNGFVQVPLKPGLGVEYDWEYIEKNRVGLVVYE